MADDRRLEETLARVLGPVDGAPPVAGIEAVRARAEAGRAMAGTGPSRRRRRVLASLAAAAVVVAFLGGVAASGAIPGPLRDAMHAVGLPVRSSAYVETEHLLSALGTAIEAREPAGLVDRLDDRMLDVVHTLDEEERDRIEPVVHQVHLRAREYVREHAWESPGGSHHG